MTGLNKAAQIEKAAAAAKNFAETAPMQQKTADVQTPTVEAAVSAEVATPSKNSPWRDNSGLTEDQLRSMERGISGSMSLELHLRLNFIKNRMNAENLGKGKKEKVSVNQLQIQAIEDYTARILKKWNYDV